MRGVVRRAAVRFDARESEPKIVQQVRPKHVRFADQRVVGIDDRPAGEHTMLIRNAYRVIRAKQKRTSSGLYSWEGTEKSFAEGAWFLGASIRSADSLVGQPCPRVPF